LARLRGSFARLREPLRADAREALSEVPDRIRYDGHCSSLKFEVYTARKKVFRRAFQGGAADDKEELSSGD